MEGLGRLYNVVATADGAAVCLEGYSGVDFLCVGADTYTLTIATSFGGAYKTYTDFTPNWVPITHYYKSTAADGTAAWTKSSITAANAIVTTGLQSVFHLSTKALPDTYTYVKCTSTAAGLVVPILVDPVIVRAPANLAIVGA